MVYFWQGFTRELGDLVSGKRKNAQQQSPSTPVMRPNNISLVLNGMFIILQSGPEKNCTKFNAPSFCNRLQ